MVYIRKFYIVIIIGFFFGCTPKTRNQIIQVECSGNDVKFQKKEIYAITKEIRENIKNFTYTGEQSFSYQISLNGTESWVVYNTDTIKLLEIDKRKYIINGNEYHVIKFVEHPDIIDGAYYHYVSLEVGFLIKRSVTWRRYSELINTQEFEVNLLKSLIFNDKKFYNYKDTVMISPPPIARILSCGLLPKQ